MNNETIITQEQYNAAVKQWCDRVRAQVRANAAAFSNGKSKPHTYIKGRYAGKTEYKLKDKTTYRIKYSSGDADHVQFIMPVHGIFREYGVGNGQPRNGKSSSTKRAQRTYIKRSMSDWIHSPIEKNIEQFGNIVAEYYGDKMLVCFKSLGTGK